MSDAVAIVRALLVADADVVAIAPEERIMAGELGQGTELPALTIDDVSESNRNILSPGATRMVTERVTVTAIAATYPEMKALLRAVKSALADFIGDVAGASAVTVHTMGAGPYFRDEQASLHMKSRDFRVTYNEST